MTRSGTWGALAAVILAGTAAIAAERPAKGAQDLAALAAQVREAELAFAKTMADRDHKSFGMFVSEEAVFISGQEVLRGRAKVMEGWKPLYEGELAPFSWEPKQVEVLDSGGLALSSGPVRDSKGNQVETYQSIWRREADGKWRVIFDKGCPACKCP